MKWDSPKQLAVDLLARSKCNVQVAAVIGDSHGVFGWGWNSAGEDGLGMHAEHHALTRSSKRRAKGATMWVAAVRRYNGKMVSARPCVGCSLRIGRSRLGRVFYRDKDGSWREVI